MKSSIQVAGALAAIATATTAGLQAEVKINENLSLDGYVIGAGVVTEGTAAKNGPEFGKSGNFYDSAYVAVNGSYKDFTSKVSLYAVNFGNNNAGDDVGILDAYVTYKVGDLALTGGKYLSWLGFESFHSPNNAFISFSQAFYASPFSTGVKADYAGEGFSTGISVRDSQYSAPGVYDPSNGGFFEGDGQFDDDIGYEAYVMVTSIENLTLFAGAGYEDVDELDASFLTYDIWASYALTESLSLAAEYAFLEDANNGSWLLQSTYKVNDPLSVSARVTGSDGDNGAADAIGYGIASTYTISPNFFVKGEVTKTDASGAAGSDTFSYALQAGFKF